MKSLCRFPHTQFKMYLEGKFFINWDDFQKTSTERFRDLVGKKMFSDVTLVTSDGTRTPAHQMILASGCSFFKKLLEELETNGKPLIFLRGVETILLNPILCFLYTGKAEVSEELLEGFIALAEDLGVEGLSRDSGKDKKPALEEKMEKFEVKEEQIEDNNTKKNVNDEKPTGMKRFHRTSGSSVQVPEIGADGLYQCYDCERKLSQRGNFRRHVEKDHLRIERKCENCNYSTTNSGMLSYHRTKRCQSKPRNETHAPENLKLNL